MSVAQREERTEETDSVCYSRFALERYLAGEFADVEHRQVEAHLAACSRCRDIVDAIRREQTEFQAQVPFERFYADLEARLVHAGRTSADMSSSSGSARWTARARAWVDRVVRGFSVPQWAGAVVAVAALVVLAPYFLDQGGDLDGVRVKAPSVGPGPLEVVLLRDGRISEAVSGDVFHPGDRLQFRVTPGSWRYLHLVSLDDQGRLTPFYPADGAPSLLLRGDAEQLLPDAIELDDFVGEERIFAIFSAEPLPFEEIERAAGALVAREGLPLDLERLLELPVDGTAQTSFLMIKE